MDRDTTNPQDGQYNNRHTSNLSECTQGPAMAQRERTGREMLLDRAARLDAQAFQLRRLAAALPEEISHDANHALINLLVNLANTGGR